MLRFFTSKKRDDYFEKRKNLLYYQAVRTLVTGLSGEAKSIIDIGSAGCPYLDWFPAIPHKTSIDIQEPYRGRKIKAIRGDFLSWKADRHYDIALCLQVLEHVDDPGAFAKKLLETANIVIASVPYQWEAGRCKSHIHDPVDENKMLLWFGRKPNFSYICHEIKSCNPRLLQVYDQSGCCWNYLNKRPKKAKKR